MDNVRVPLTQFLSTFEAELDHSKWQNIINNACSYDFLIFFFIYSKQRAYKTKPFENRFLLI